MPRCCSSRIQSEVAWRAALRPLTVPAMVMAPPNSSSFSVSVVLPASGCETIAKVRRRRISASSSVMSSDRGSGARGAEGAPENGGVLAAVAGLIIAAAHAHLLEAEGQVKADRRGVRRTHLEERVRHAGGGSALDERAEQAAADAAAAIAFAHAQIEDVGLTGAEAHHAVRHHLAGEGHYAADIAHAKAVAEDPLAPGKLVRGTLDGDDLGDIVAAHRTDHDLG